MKQKTINIYEFKELKPEIQEKVLSKFRNNEEFIFLEDTMKEVLDEVLKKNKIKVINNLDLDYSLGYSQGDGLSFTGLFQYKNYFVCIKRTNCNYSHSNSTDLYFYKDEDFVEEIKDKKEFMELYQDICKELEKYGYSYMEDCTSDNTIKENMEANEYMFNEFGGLE